MRLGGAKAQRCATTSVLAVASGRSANSSSIIGADLTKASGLERGALGAVEMGRMGDAQHRVVRRVHVRIAEVGRIGRDQRQVARIGELDQRRPRPPPRPDRRGAPARRRAGPGTAPASRSSSASARSRLALGEQPRHRALARPGQRDQALGAPVEIVERDMRLELERPVEMRAADQVAQVLPAGLVLRVERQVVDRPVRRRARRRAACRRSAARPSALHAAANAGVP